MKKETLTKNKNGKANTFNKKNKNEMSNEISDSNLDNISGGRPLDTISELDTGNDSITPVLK
ncbi:MAG TPA: hypothetical protein PKY81_11270 [bacterium]|nr:hypothetical protein [bacterium]